jgi:DNA-binding response OmpR family regulator
VLSRQSWSLPGTTWGSGIFKDDLKTLLRNIHCPDGEAALNIIRERKIHLITLDLSMPKLSGIETLREIRKIDAEVPVIIITGYGTQKDEEEALLYGVKAF